MWPKNKPKHTHTQVLQINFFFLLLAVQVAGWLAGDVSLMTQREM